MITFCCCCLFVANLESKSFQISKDTFVIQHGVQVLVPLIQVGLQHLQADLGVIMVAVTHAQTAQEATFVLLDLNDLHNNGLAICKDSGQVRQRAVHG